jgi:hypothetical protein
MVLASGHAVAGLPAVVGVCLVPDILTVAGLPAVAVADGQAVIFSVIDVPIRCR